MASLMGTSTAIEPLTALVTPGWFVHRLSCSDDCSSKPVSNVDQSSTALVPAVPIVSLRLEGSILIRPFSSEGTYSLARVSATSGATGDALKASPGSPAGAGRTRKVKFTRVLVPAAKPVPIGMAHATATWLATLVAFTFKVAEADADPIAADCNSSASVL